MDHLDRLTDAVDAITARTAALSVYRDAWNGTSPAAFLSTKSADALDGRLNRLGMNYVRLIVSSRCDRLRVTGFRRAEQQDTDAALWSLWRRAGLIATSEQVHAVRDLYGAAYVFVWGHARRPRVPVVTPCSPWHATAVTDPATGEVVQAVRTWATKGKSGDVEHATMFEPDVIRTYRTRSTGQWETVATVENPWGVVPCVPFLRRTSLDDTEGTSAVADVLDLSDAAAKVVQDALVTSEYYARPRRWATGLELQEDPETGEPIDPFGDGRFLQSEDPATKFGQLDPPRLDGYGDLVSILVQQIAAMSGLPPHYVGLHGDQPSNVDSIRAAETQLTSAAYSEQRHLDPAWARVVAMLHAVATDGHPDDVDAVPVWASPEVRTPGQAADAAAKLAGIGVPLQTLLVDPLGMDPQQASKITDQQRLDHLTAAAATLSAAAAPARPAEPEQAPARPKRQHTGRAVFR